MTCASCGRANRPGRKFCAGCGAPLLLACPACGAANEPDEGFCGECGTQLETAAAPAPEAAGVERRLVSVLFADLVGFTPLAEARDAEEVRDLLSRYFDQARQIVERYGGQVEKFIGDAVMAVWGTPVAREDDAERAVRAALDLVGSVEGLGVDGLAARAGVLTGEAVVTLGATGQGMVAGDLVNTASRIQTAAEPGTVLVGEGTRRASEASIAYADAGLHELKGKAEPLPLWQALRVTAARAGALKSDRLEPPFVGRERELRLIKELFHAGAEERKAHLVSVTGIAGIGKSRLAWEFAKYVDGIAQTVRWHRGRCLAYGEGVTYWALAEMVRMRCEIAEGEEPESAREKLRAALAEHVGDEEERAWIEPRLAHLLALEQRQVGDQTDIFAGWRLFFERLADRNPVVLVFEDMQWADAALLEFLAYLLEWSRNHAILVLALARPELGDRHPSWASGIRNATTLAVEPLSPAAMSRLLEGLVPGLPEDLTTRILERAEGVPLYAVETVRMLLDRGLLEREGDAYRPVRTVHALDVPETLHALVAARLDGLSAEERGTLQTAAVLGKTFASHSLGEVAGVPDEQLHRLLTALVRKEILFVEGNPRSPERGQYGFLQDLLRQVAYDTLPRKERKARHLATAAHLESRAGGEPEWAEIVASHYLAALEADPGADDAPALRDRARAALVRAGERAASLAASEEAQRYFEQALELASRPLEEAELAERAGRMAKHGGRWDAARAHLERAIGAFQSQGLPHGAARAAAALAEVAWTGEHRVDDAVAGLERVLEVLTEDEPDADVATAAAQLARFLFFAGRLDEAMERNELALDLAESLDLPEVLSQALNTKHLILMARRRIREAGVLIRYSLEVALERDLHDAALRAYNNLAVYAGGADRYDEAFATAQAGLELAEKLGRRPMERMFRRGVSFGLAVRGEWDEALAQVDELRAREDWDPADSTHLVGVLAMRGEVAEARRRLAEAEATVDPGDVQMRANFLAAEAVVLLAEGRATEALAAAEEGLAESERTAFRWDVHTVTVAFEAASALGDRAKADELLAWIEAIPPGQALPSLTAAGARFAARLAAHDGDATSAEAGFRAAAERFGGLRMPFEQAWTQLDHAEWLVSQGRLEEAAPLLDEAGETFERLRARPFLERVARARGQGAAATPASAVTS